MKRVIRRKPAKPKKRIIGFIGRGTFSVGAPTPSAVQGAARKATRCVTKKKPLTYMIGGIEKRSIKPIHSK